MTHKESHESQKISTDLAQELFSKIRNQGEPNKTSGYFNVVLGPIQAIGSTWYLKAITARHT